MDSLNEVQTHDSKEIKKMSTPNLLDSSKRTANMSASQSSVTVLPEKIVSQYSPKRSSSASSSKDVNNARRTPNIEVNRERGSSVEKEDLAKAASVLLMDEHQDTTAKFSELKLTENNDISKPSNDPMSHDRQQSQYKFDFKTVKRSSSVDRNRKRVEKFEGRKPMKASSVDFSKFPSSDCLLDDDQDDDVSEKAQRFRALYLAEKEQREKQMTELNRQMVELKTYQTNYNSLLKQHAETKNTIDMLRLGAKVTLYSDAPPTMTAVSGAQPAALHAHKFSIPKVGTASYATMSEGTVNNQPQKPQLGFLTGDMLFIMAHLWCTVINGPLVMHCFLWHTGDALL